MGQKQDELLKRIQKLVKTEPGPVSIRMRNCRRHVTELSEQNEMMKLRLKEARVDLKEDPSLEAKDADQEI